ncbi:MAG: hypothetical protein AB8B36_11170, partial [Prochlorococcus sp.]
DVCLASVVLFSVIFWPAESNAQTVVRRLREICPLGHVATFNGKCSSLGLMTYTVKTIAGKACPAGRMAFGGGYCRRK